MDQTMNIQILEDKNQIKLLKKILTEQLSTIYIQVEVQTQSLINTCKFRSPEHVIYNELYPVSFTQPS
jgi:hypothetical protein